MGCAIEISLEKGLQNGYQCISAGTILS